MVEALAPAGVEATVHAALEMLLLGSSLRLPAAAESQGLLLPPAPSAAAPVPPGIPAAGLLAPPASATSKTHCSHELKLAPVQASRCHEPFSVRPRL